MYPIELRIQPGVLSIFQKRKTDTAFLSFSEKIFKRDKYTCQFCGFQTKDYQEVINLDQNYNNNKAANVVTACCFCAQCFFIESVGVGYGGGSLIYLPEITQGELNNFCHLLFCAITQESDYKETSQNIYRSLKFRTQPVEQQFGEGTSDPAVFAQLLINAEGFELESARSLLKNIRLLPSRARFKEQIEKWSVTAFKDSE